MQSDRSDMFFLTEPSKFKGRLHPYVSSDMDNVISLQKTKKPQSLPIEAFRWDEDQQQNWGDIWKSLNSSRTYPKELSSQLERLESKVDSELLLIKTAVSEISGTISSALLLKHSAEQPLGDGQYDHVIDHNKIADLAPDFFDSSFANFDADNVTEVQISHLQMAIDFGVKFPVFVETATQMLGSSKGKNRAMASRVLAVVSPEKAISLLPDMIKSERNGTARNVAIAALRSVSE